MMIEFDPQNVMYSLAPLAILGGVLGRFITAGATTSVITVIVKLLSKPLFLGVIVGILLYYPETVAWILMKIGEIEIKIFGLILGVIMPDMYPGDETNEIAGIWNNATSVFPQEVIDTMASLDLAGLMGMVSTTLVAGFTIKIYFHLMKKLGL